MIKTDMYIEIVSSTIPGLSSMSEPSRKDAHLTLSQHYTNVVITIVNDLEDLQALVSRAPDLVFLGMKFIFNDTNFGNKNTRKIWLSEYLETAGIAYTGSDQQAHELERYKPLAKRCVRDAGAKTSPFTVIGKHATYTDSDIGIPFPLFIKPTSSGGGTGVDEKSLVHNFAELRLKVAAIAEEHHSDSLIEAYLPGREFSVAILADEFTNRLHVMPIELKADEDENGDRVLSQLLKSLNTEVVTAISDGPLRNGVISLAMQAFRALGARDYGRIDIRLDSKGVPNFLEANLIPSLIDGYGSFPKACRINQTMSYETMLLQIVRLALQRRTSVELPTIDGRVMLSSI